MAKSRSPACVNENERVVRSTSRTPRLSSSARTCELTKLLDTPRTRAALVNERWRTSCAKTVRWGSCCGVNTGAFSFWVRAAVDDVSRTKSPAERPEWRILLLDVRLGTLRRHERQVRPRIFAFSEAQRNRDARPHSRLPRRARDAAHRAAIFDRTRPSRRRR